MSEKEKYVKLTEYNSWEGETWYHYFIDNPGVFKLLLSLKEHPDTDFTDIECIALSDEEATILVNIDGEYMQPHWFGEVDLSRLSGVMYVKDLYKGQIRNYAEDLFELVEVEQV